ncbi:MAG: MBL fold metallo-hydrolase [Candidatus Lokiarchaeota archaeon]|nr:MBL fold metallo-hydrolase [Candidatus Lokiarchaeota archaeon]
MTSQLSIDRFPKVKKMGVTVDCGDFLIIRPESSYRMHSSVIILKGEEPVIIDTGTTKDPGLKRITKSLHKHAINPLSVKYILLTHSHSDHVLQLYGLEKLCANAKVICHEKDEFNIQHPTRMENSWQKALKLLGKSQINLFLYRILSIPGYMVFYRSINLYPRIDYVVKNPETRNGFRLDNFPKIQAGKNILHFIPTHGHSAGHTCIYNSNDKILFLGDFVPFTPWINPLPEALDDMINSLENFLTLTTDQVHFTVSAHGDIRKENWEITPWDEQRKRFRLFLDTINETLERIPKLLHRRALSTEHLAQLLIPNYKRYLWVMRVLFIPPALTWILSYCQKLEKQGKIRSIIQRNTVLWSSE